MLSNQFTDHFEVAEFLDCDVLQHVADGGVFHMKRLEPKLQGSGRRKPALPGRHRSNAGPHVPSHFGYYNLAAGYSLNELPEALGKKLPRYPSVPVARLGRLAVDQAHRGRQVGAGLLWDATVRALRADMGVFALVVDAKNEQAEAFYRKHGFVAFGSLRQLILPLKALPGGVG
jgi:ribosomal protein S18 acetylase RimI-like enzyme